MHELMSIDKKSKEGRVRFVLLERVGSAVARADVPFATVNQTLSKLTA
jgi:3-dehydroquinate synthetase